NSGDTGLLEMDNAHGFSFSACICPSRQPDHQDGRNVSHLCCDLKRANSELDCDYAENADRHLELDCDRWNGSVSCSKLLKRPSLQFKCGVEVPGVCGRQDRWTALDATRPAFLTVLVQSTNPKETLLACYCLKARRHAPGLMPTVRLNSRAK